MAKIKAKYSYEIVIAEPFMCVPACLEIILNIYGFNLNQNEIAEYFGIHVPQDYEGKISNIIKTDEENKWGIVFRENSLNDFFKDKALPLNERFVPINTLADWEFEEVVQKNLIEGNHLICGFSYEKLYKGFNNDNIGHVSIIESINSENIMLLDPGPHGVGRKNVNVYDLFKAIHFKKDGLWIISE